MSIKQDSQVIEQLRAYKAQLLAGENSLMEEMAARWVQAENALVSDINALVLEMTQLEQSGQAVTQGQLARMERYQRLMFQVRAQSSQYVAWAGDKITAQQAQTAELGLIQATHAIKGVYYAAGAVSPAFDQLPVDAIESMIGLAGDGSPLTDYLRKMYGESANGITQALIDGLVKGVGPADVAQMMIDGFGVGLQTAMNTARTETLRAYRLSSLMQYDASGVVSGYKRLAAHDGRSCIGCLFTEGEFYESLDEFDEHNQGRCTTVPVVKGVNAPTWLSGADWFETQNEETQQSILGSGRFDAWKNGTALSDMVKRVRDPVWGGAFIPMPVNELP